MTTTRERFEAEFPAEEIEHEDESYSQAVVASPEALLQFVESEKAIQREGLAEKITKLAKEPLDKTDPDNYEACFAVAGFNDALQKVLSLLTPNHNG